MSKPSRDQELEFIDHARYRETREVEAFLKKYPAVIEGQDALGRTALWWAACNGHEDTVALLLRNKADINADEWNRETPLIIAASQGYEPVVKLLLKSGADITRKNLQGWTAEVVAERMGNRNIAALLAEWPGMQAREEFLKKTDFSRGLDKPIPRVRVLKLPPS
jgi:ankyrin repeat protein